MALKANYGKRDLLKTIKTIVPKGAKLRDALATAAKFGVKKGAMGKLNQTQTKELVHALKDEHAFKSRINGVSTYGSTVKGIIETATAPKKEEGVDPHAALKAKLAEKQKLNDAMKAKTASENPEHGKVALTEEQKQANIKAGQESAAAADAEIARRSGIKADRKGKGGNDDRGGVELAPMAPTIPVAHPHPGQSLEVSFPESDSPSPAVSEAIARDVPLPVSPQEPAKASEAIDMDIG